MIRKWTTFLLMAVMSRCVRFYDAGTTGAAPVPGTMAGKMHICAKRPHEIFNIFLAINNTYTAELTKRTTSQKDMWGP